MVHLNNIVFQIFVSLAANIVSFSCRELVGIMSVITFYYWSGNTKPVEALCQ